MEAKGTAPRHRILLIGINYAPELTGIAPYTTELAEHFASIGHSVHVVTGLPHYPEWRRMPVPRPTLVENLNVQRTWHFIPSRPNALARMLYEFTWLGTAAPATVRGSYDVVLGTIPSLSGGLLAVLAGRLHRIPVGLVVKDLIGPAASQSGYRGGRLVSGITTLLERSAVRRANAVAVISDGFRGYLTGLGVDPRRIFRVTDWTHPGEPTESAEECRRRLGWASNDFICLHAGNMGQKQGLDNLLDAAVLLNGRIRIVLSGHGNDRSRLMNRAKQLRLTNIAFVDLQPPGKYEAMLLAADVLLLNQRASVGEMSLPSKLASYFAAGRPVVASVAQGSPAALEVRRSAAGIVVPPDDAPALANALQTLSRSPAHAAALGTMGAAFARAELTQTVAFGEYHALLARLVEDRTAQVFVTE